ncbi:anthranilate synthase component II [Mesohalobacter halotolerans]|jgi:anthranilate synthase component 2|uniref:Aminodeoxychorismate/anthranilate synthase component II n=1 Tax=Mesohalobacter halotolerans TaxID=1883405 RepID=A0A4U5TPB8_9FLAO|nr:aminodeoxychorismate/anthranilate synthase component II [Mesohalobacter halotolerans]MBS3739383.1 aminodeoxychorismate/anthranilate synthase component II [Psychroflexus sp.]NBC58158.1 aminodeoxychorismate/anthranilate synthase component II [Bacteroidota bacterium]TKS55521.1 aminodeoxychorismate/anthranilate synthase component II [Mesohalobacter halotolerans]
MKKILVIDNYDSFVYNLVHYLEAFDAQVDVVRNKSINLEAVKNYDKILLSPGPGIPDEAGQLKSIIKTYYKTKPILGVCLGQQAITEVFGGQLENLKTVYHGIATAIKITVKDEVLYQNLPEEIEVGRYHSWVVQNALPEVLEATSVDDKGNIMSLRHKHYNVKAVQYHPESVLTPHGKTIIQNWLNS